MVESDMHKAHKRSPSTWDLKVTLDGSTCRWGAQPNTLRRVPRLPWTVFHQVVCDAKWWGTDAGPTNHHSRHGCACIAWAPRGSPNEIKRTKDRYSHWNKKKQRNKQTTAGQQVLSLEFEHQLWINLPIHQKICMSNQHLYWEIVVELTHPQQLIPKSFTCPTNGSWFFNLTPGVVSEGTFLVNKPSNGNHVLS